MSWDDNDDKTIYKVVLNHEEQYSIWPADRENALGWKDEGKVGPKQECLDRSSRQNSNNKISRSLRNLSECNTRNTCCY